MNPDLVAEGRRLLDVLRNCGTHSEGDYMDADTGMNQGEQ